jgi:2-methylcitrate dehydratase PrpD
VNHTEALSRFVVDCRIEDFPPNVIEVARKCVLDWIGVTVGAVGDPAVLLLKETVEDMEGRQQASILGYGTKTTMANAALVNGRWPIFSTMMTPTAV